MPAAEPFARDAEDLALIRRVAIDAAELALSYFQSAVKIWNKAPGHPVTEADLAVNAFIARELRSARPDYGWLSEETTDTLEDRQQERVFVVDPIDGTRAFIKGEPYWCVGIACLSAGRSVAGAVVNPVTGEVFTACLGGGASLNGEPISVSACDGIQGCNMIAAESLLVRRDLPSPLPEMKIADPKPNATLYRLALVADGRWDATIALWRKSDWDLAPASILIEEAGGVATTHDGVPYVFNRYVPVQKSMLAAGPRLHSLLTERLRSVPLPDPAAPAPVQHTNRQKPAVMTDTQPTQLLHLVFGGELKDVSDVVFEDLSKVDFVGAFGSYAEAYDAWKAAAQRTVDNAEMRYFILHAHKLLDPETGDHFKV